MSLPHWPALPLLLALAWPCAAQQAARAPGTPRTPGRLVVSGFNSDALHVYRTWDGAPRGTVTPVQGAQSIAAGPDGLLYVCAEGSNEILRLDGDSLAFVDVFVADDPLTPGDETGGLDGPTAAFFGPGGDLFVASFETDAILRYDGATGTFLEVFVPAGDGGLDGPDAGTEFGPDGNLYVPSFWNDRVLRYTSDGTFLDEFVSFQEGSLRRPRDVAFHRGFVYVASSLNHHVLRYDMAGNFVDVFTDSHSCYSLAFHPTDGNLYVVSLQRNNVRVYDGETGAFVRRAVANGENGLDGATYVFVLP